MMEHGPYTLKGEEPVYVYRLDIVYIIAYAIVFYLVILRPSEKALVTNQLKRFSK